MKMQLVEACADWRVQVNQTGPARCIARLYNTRACLVAIGAGATRYQAIARLIEHVEGGWQPAETWYGDPSPRPVLAGEDKERALAVLMAARDAAEEE